MSLLNRKIEFWKKFEAAIFEVLIQAIDILYTKSSLPESEDELNRRFYFCLVEANYNLQKINKGLQSPPFYEANNQPLATDNSKTQREDKRPDFQWSITDINEMDPIKSSKQFVLECKRLGVAKSSWILNANYINNGINRFVSSGHGYATGAESAAMLGYIQSMSTNDILNEINLRLSTTGQYPIDLISNKKECYFLSHTIKTDALNTLRLEHIWVDLKRYY